MSPFELALPGRVLFGCGRLREVGEVARELGKRALVVTGGSRRRAAQWLELLAAAGVRTEVFAVTGEPTTTAVERGVDAARQQGADVVIGIGGGSAIDAAKAIAALVTNPGALLDYLEVIGLGKPLERSPLPFIAVPTTAGTGAEATRNAVLASPAHRVKVSLRSPLMLPRVAIVDPELTHELPPEITASTGLDALTQLIEALVSTRANPLTESLCRDGIARAAEALPVAFAQASLDPRPPGPIDPRHAAAREAMALASLWSGLALANAGLGAVHGFAGPLGGMFDAAHGAICAALLPEVMHTNIHALRRRAPADRALDRYTEIARLLTGRGDATAERGVEAIRQLCAGLRVPSLRRVGVTLEQVPALVAGARRASSMRTNPIVLTDEELAGILERSI
ncbi:MAG: iron-containing alcohol dehydrogenase [Verrucomicrobia bacterium]|nr:iron-containing alcohol dehydrogenase [Verrucomicrobiota bacterium]